MSHVSRPRLPDAIPLPDLSKYTDAIVFDTPQLESVDPERIIVRPRRFQRTQSVAGLGAIGVRFDDEPGSSLPELHMLERAAYIASEPRALTLKRGQDLPLSSPEIHFLDRTASKWERPYTTITVHRLAIEGQAAERVANKGIDPTKAKVALLDHAIRNSLTEASFSANFDRSKMEASVLCYATFAAVWAGLYGELNPISLLVYGTLRNQIAPFGPRGSLRSMEGAEGWRTRGWSDTIEQWKQYRKSLFYGLTPDRYLAAQALTRTLHFVEMRP